MRKEEFDRLISRRSFLKGAALSAAGVAALGMVGGVSAAEAEESASSAGVGYEIINTDLLVVGAGNNAMTAAAFASTAGKNVTVVDKGVYRHSGTSGMSWDAFSNFNTPEMFESAVAGREAMLTNHEAFIQALYTDPQPNKFVDMINHGQSLPDRTPDGKVKPYWIDVMCMGQFFRRHMDDLHEKGNVTVVDQTMITDILMDENKVCVGAIGLHIPTGTLKIFRSKATVLATGGCTWLYGWLTVSAATIGNPDNTADADMAAYRHGAGIGDSEFAQYDVLGIYPEGLGYGFGANICADAQEAHTMVDVNGDPVFAPDDPMVADRIYFAQELAKVIAAGRGTPNGGVYVNIGDVEIRYANDRNLPLLKKFGVDARKERMEVSPEMYEHSGCPIIDSKMMTEIPGLFHGRGAGTNGEMGGGQCYINEIFGTYTGRCAVEYMDALESTGEVDWEGVLKEYDRLHEIRTRQVEDGVRPHVIRHAIQRTCGKSLGIYRSTELLEESLAELQRIRKEDLPRQIVTSASPTWNREWKEAIENYNMLDIAEMSVRASLLREETRGMYLRPEFPQVDNENWACTLVCYDRDGEMVFEKKTEWA